MPTSPAVRTLGPQQQRTAKTGAQHIHFWAADLAKAIECNDVEQAQKLAEAMTEQLGRTSKVLRAAKVRPVPAGVKRVGDLSSGDQISFAVTVEGQMAPGVVETAHLANEHGGVALSIRTADGEHHKRTWHADETVDLVPVG
jgi:hypothetical protein